ncbi:X antigen family member 5-like, partial [Mesoplodon densirostris]|uniref:X antigen family member 5-like n=1 Tax=Mesoplodon densirostris TaxID=48708 RepID=UPI0028DCE5A7
PVVQPGDKQPKQEKPLTESQDITPGEEKMDEGAYSVKGPAVEANQQELAQPKTGCGCGDGSDVKGKRLPNPEPIKEPEAGEGQPQV